MMNYCFYRIFSNISRSPCKIINNLLLSCGTKVVDALDRAFANFTEITTEKNIFQNRKIIKRLLLRVLTDLLFHETDVAYCCEVIEMALADIINWDGSYKIFIPEVLRGLLKIRLFRSEVRNFVQQFDLENDTFIRVACGLESEYYCPHCTKLTRIFHRFSFIQN